MGGREISTGYLVEKSEDSRSLEDIDVNRRIILKSMLKRWENVDWRYLAQDGEYWLAVVITVMNLQGPQNFGEFFDQLRKY